VSRYISILNDIKSSLGVFSLTPRQSACRARIEERLAYPGVVNLCGLHGVGKTVLGWVMAAGGQVVYVVHSSRLKKSSLTGDSIVFIDNAESDRTAFRRLLGVLELAGVERAVVVTRPPADDYVFRAKLELTNEDVETMQENLKHLGHVPPKGDWSNLWHVLLQVAREEQ
jgi:hypothetical protein